MDGHRIRLVLIEDDEDDYIITRELLEESEWERFSIQWAPTLAEGLALLSGDVDAILSDLTLPDSSGWETFTSVHNAAPHLPVILLTGLSDEELGERAVQSGAQDYLVKGNMDSPLLCRAIRYAIERKQIDERLSNVVAELRARNAQMDAELAMAREMQLALLPRQYPLFPASALPHTSALQFSHRYRPCLALGGDFFDVQAASDTVATILVCDVMGHGVQPALVTAVVRGLVEELKPLAHDPGLLMSELNRDLTRLLQQPEQLIFVSAVCVAVDAATGEMAWANAGHPEPVLLGTGGAPSRLTADAGAVAPAMGIDDDHTYSTHKGVMKVGDRLVLFTDGLYEMLNTDGEEFGEERLVAAASDGYSGPLDAMLDGVLGAVEAFSGTADLSDDVCLVGLEVRQLLRNK